MLTKVTLGRSAKTVARIGPKRCIRTSASCTASLGAVRHRASRKRSSAAATADPSYIGASLGPRFCLLASPTIWNEDLYFPAFLGNLPAACEETCSGGGQGL